MCTHTDTHTEFPETLPVDVNEVLKSEAGQRSIVLSKGLHPCLTLVIFMGCRCALTSHPDFHSLDGHAALHKQLEL